MASDNTVLNAGSGGETLRSLADSSNITWPVGASAYATTISSGANVLQIVTPALGMPVQPSSAATFPVSGTFWQTTQPVSLATLPALVAGTALVGQVEVSDGTNVLLTSSHPGFVQFESAQAVTLTSTTITGSVAVTGTFWQATQPVSAASLPLPTGAATSAEQTTGNTSLATLAGIVTGSTAAVSLASLPSLAAGSNAIGSVAVTSGTITTVGAVTAITDALPAGTNSIGGVTITSSASGGCSTFHLVAANTTNATSLKGSAGTLKSVQVYNVGAAAAYLKFYNTAGTPTAGSGTPTKVIMIPGNTAGAGSNVILPPEGVSFGTGIGFTVTGGIADSDATSVTAANILIEIDYK